DGAGLFWSIELVRDRRTGEHFVKWDDMGAGDIDNWPVSKISRHCLSRGVFITGFVPNIVRVGRHSRSRRANATRPWRRCTALLPRWIKIARESTSDRGQGGSGATKHATRSRDDGLWLQDQRPIGI